MLHWILSTCHPCSEKKESTPYIDSEDWKRMRAQFTRCNLHSSLCLNFRVHLWRFRVYNTLHVYSYTKLSNRYETTVVYVSIGWLKSIKKIQFWIFCLQYSSTMTEFDSHFERKLSINAKIQHLHGCCTKWQMAWTFWVCIFECTTIKVTTINANKKFNLPCSHWCGRNQSSIQNIILVFIIISCFTYFFGSKFSGWHSNGISISISAVAAACVVQNTFIDIAYICVRLFILLNCSVHA